MLVRCWKGLSRAASFAMLTAMLHLEGTPYYVVQRTGTVCVANILSTLAYTNICVSYKVCAFSAVLCLHCFYESRMCFFCK